HDQHLPLRHLSAHPRGRAHGRRHAHGQWLDRARAAQAGLRRPIMNSIAKVSPPAFLLGSAAPGGGLALGFAVPLPPAAAQGTALASEMNVGVAIKAEDTCVMRIARSEMGQGTITGLAQLVAEELECDWRKVALEQITPGRNLASKRAWGEMGTGGSRGIR